MASKFIVIDKGTANDWADASIIMDENGRNKIFYTHSLAAEELNQCQNGIVIGDEELPDDTPTLINEIEDYFNKILASYSTELREEVKTRLLHPYDLLNKIEQWKSTVK